MINPQAHQRMLSPSSAWTTAVLVSLSLLMMPVQSRADYTIRLDEDVASVSSVAGGTIRVGVVLATTSDLTLSGFNIQLDLLNGPVGSLIPPSAGVGFGAATEPLTGYVFSGSSAGFLAQPLDGIGNPVTFPAPSVSISDVAVDVLGNITALQFGPGEFRLGEIGVNVLPGAGAGRYSVTTNADGTALFTFDQASGDLAQLPVDEGMTWFSVDDDGPVTPTPAPGGLALIAIGSTLISVFKLRRWCSVENRLRT